uniref:Uncharacterized protein n=1 Tax=Rhipicephalus pulchellus TaxID=72859 RepID=L7LY85_RHIPC
MCFNFPILLSILLTLPSFSTRCYTILYKAMICLTLSSLLPLLFNLTSLLTLSSISPLALLHCTWLFPTCYTTLYMAPPSLVLLSFLLTLTTLHHTLLCYTILYRDMLCFSPSLPFPTPCYTIL